MPRLSGLMAAVPVGLGYEHPRVGQWMSTTAFELGRRNLVDKFMYLNRYSSRILLNRNVITQEARKYNVRYLLMCDPDMNPDMYYYAPHPELPRAEPFLGSSLAFLKDNPCSVIAAPATCSPPGIDTNVWISDPETGEGKKITDHDAALRTRSPSIEQVPAIGTGLILIDMLVFDAIERDDMPFFDDIYEDAAKKTSLKMGQDVFFTSRCHTAGVGVYCNWYSWAGHWKGEWIGAPELNQKRPEYSPWAAAASDDPSLDRYARQEATAWEPPITLG